MKEVYALSTKCGIHMVNKIVWVFTQDVENLALYQMYVYDGICS